MPVSGAAPEAVNWSWVQCRKCAESGWLGWRGCPLGGRGWRLSENRLAPRLSGVLNYEMSLWGRPNTTYVLKWSCGAYAAIRTYFWTPAYGYVLRTPHPGARLWNTRSGGVLAILEQGRPHGVLANSPQGNKLAVANSSRFRIDPLRIGFLTESATSLDGQTSTRTSGISAMQLAMCYTYSGRDGIVVEHGLLVRAGCLPNTKIARSHVRPTTHVLTR